MRHPLTAKVVSVVAVATSVVACSDEPDTTALAPGDGVTIVTHADSPNRLEACPNTGLTAPSAMRLVDRSLPNLGSGILGRIEVYDSPTERLEINVGVDVLDRYEDLDFERSTIALSDVEATVSRAGAFGTDDRLVILTWDQPGEQPPCSKRSLIGTNMTEDELRMVADS